MFVEACRKADLIPGLYTPPWHDAHHQDWRDPQYFQKRGDKAWEAFTRLRRAFA